MSAQNIRLPRDWQRFDKTGSIGMLFLPIALAALWINGFGPSRYLSCQGNPMEIRLSSEAGKLRLAGSVVDVADKTVLVQAARQAYGADNVVDDLKIDAQAARLAWSGNAPNLVRRLRRAGPGVAITVKGQEALVEGTVESELARDDVSRDVADLLGSGTKLKTALAVKPAPVVPPVAKVEPPAVVVAPPPKPAEIAAGATGTYRLPNGAEIAIVGGGLESNVLAFLNDASRGIDRGLWFDFDRLQFRTGSSELTAESRAQIDTLVAILKAYPTAAVKIGGYTDNVGDPDANLKLSQARAERVASEIVTLGIAAGRIEAEGYGEQHPIASNDTPEGRAKNRRTALSVRSK